MKQSESSKVKTALLDFIKETRYFHIEMAKKYGTDYDTSGRVRWE